MSAQTPAKITLEEITQRSCPRRQQSGFAHAFVQYRHGHL